MYIIWNRLIGKRRPKGGVRDEQRLGEMEISEGMSEFGVYLERSNEQNAGLYLQQQHVIVGAFHRIS